MRGINRSKCIPDGFLASVYKEERDVCKGGDSGCKSELHGRLDVRKLVCSPAFIDLEDPYQDGTDTMGCSIHPCVGVSLT